MILRYMSADWRSELHLYVNSAATAIVDTFLGRVPFIRTQIFGLIYTINLLLVLLLKNTPWIEFIMDWLDSLTYLFYRVHGPIFLLHRGYDHKLPWSQTWKQQELVSHCQLTTILLSHTYLTKIKRRYLKLPHLRL